MVQDAQDLVASPLFLPNDAILDPERVKSLCSAALNGTLHPQAGYHPIKLCQGARSAVLSWFDPIQNFRGSVFVRPPDVPENPLMRDPWKFLEDQVRDILKDKENG